VIVEGSPFFWSLSAASTDGGHWQRRLAAAMLGGQQATLSRIVYELVGLSALWQLMPFVRAMRVGQTHAEGNITHRR
jgi:uncharacterized membrane protein YuzA (DUF378 family)